MTQYFIYLLNESRKVGFLLSLNDIKNFTQDEGLIFEKQIKNRLNDQFN